MSQSLFSLKQLVPEFSILWEGTWQSSDGFSAIIVAFLLAIGLFFAVWTAYYFIRSFLKVNFFSKLLKGVKPEDLAQEQRNILNKALDKNNEYGKLWREFNETLVLSADKRRLHNTLDAAHFFNTRSLARNLTENRLLSAVPGFLTAIGVIGTFAGLEMGLANLQLNSQAGVDALRDGINSMINGASVAFITSVWGVFCSVVFNFYEKVLERIIRRKITNLQNKIDYLYPRINAEQSLVSIADYSRSSNETLQGLAEKIGTTMQEALVQTTDTIRTGLEDSLNTILQPAIQALVDNTNQSSEKVLNNLVERFIGSVGDAGNTQRDIMKQASSDLCEAT
ncbi:MAG: anti-phage ZorAB system protein ZorA, partial [Pseudomonadota bacterium]|nr:anti-phage ZorAB system protein ZorA [Pseudomonadota bacterium]